MSKMGQRIKRLRESKGLSRRQLENMAEVPHGVISRLESNERAYPSIPVAIRLAKIFGVTLDYLCGVYEDEPDVVPPGIALAWRQTIPAGVMHPQIASASL